MAILTRLQLWSCGGGRQSAGIAAFICEGRLPRPDHVVMAAIRGEKRTTWDYVCGHIRPAMRKLGIPFTIVPSVKYATKGIWGGADLQSPLLPMHTNESGQTSKLPEWCSGEWKRDVVSRWAAEQPGWKSRGIDNWIGISFDESHRRRAARRQWIQPVYPLLDMMGKMVHVSACLAAVERQGWPEPPRSRCVWCPNQSDAEWLELEPSELERACKLEEEIQQTDPHAWMHRSMIPLRMVQFDEADKDARGGCTAGMCF